MIFSSFISSTQHFLNPRLLGSTLLAGVLMSGCASGPAPVADLSEASKTPQALKNQTPENFPDSLADPFEPVNRGINNINEKVLFGFIRPTTKVYRSIAPPPARKSVSNFARNITYPTRLVNNVFQGRWKGAGQESLRFLTNSTVGIAGLFDPASHWKIPKSDADFAETFYKWGWHPNNFIMLPVLGPSDDLHLPGRLADRAVDPLNYFSELAPVNGGIVLNRLSDQTEPIVQFVEVEADPYAGLKYLWTYSSKEHQPDWAITAPQDPSSLQTIGAAFIRFDDPEFAIQGRQGSVRLSSTGRKIKYNYWFQKHHAPLVYIAPGTGGHRLSANILIIAENLYQNGYSVVTTVGTFHPEFMENASTTEIPAYPPVDCRDLLTSLTEINQSLEKKHPGRFGKRALIGLSLGGFQSLYLAANETRTDPNAIRFDRYVAINPPVNLRYSNKQLDHYYQIPSQWPASERQKKINNTLHKVSLLPFLPQEKLQKPPFDGEESKYLVGLTFRLLLRDSIYSSQYRHNLGIIKTPLNKWRRNAAYNEILQYSFDDYYTHFVLPYYQEKGITNAHFDRSTKLQSYQSALRSDQRIRVITNKDDFLLSSKDLSWLRSTFDRSRLTLFPSGGHVGNIASPSVEAATLKSLEGLK